MTLIDIGANLTHDSFDADRDEVIHRAQEAGIVQFIVTGGDVEHSRKALELCRIWSGVLYCTAGTHPHQAKGFDATAPVALQRLLAEPEVVAVGECGLDYFRNFSPQDQQRRAFETQLELAEETGKPVFLHQRDAHGDFISILRHWRPRLSGAVVHCFTDGEQELRDYLTLDCHIGITGWICDERRGSHLRELVRQIPADQLMLETDAPYLLPRDLNPKPRTHRNEPVYLAHICEVTAACVGKSTEQLAAETAANTQRFFKLPTNGTNQLK
ncbi:MAG: TatD family hydrolase [Gammaproteobacteria bacterium]|nr:TatD family hydrolase [Gammaproteobacteria bacterium]MBU6509625.1 TatD family hydrolase [Gammaproteobacteria bacterium]MDE1983719.1 TatD family hydrolase [Gammaproteobacteria bacterium]MDE2108470.1 TatD family hydrolase [Gammaproteobacteria bacterium]MDE2461104.1 TatD family hydrolase [Gammaproteobacteria bacterium]